jgi:hypothetical protein
VQLGQSAKSGADLCLSCPGACGKEHQSQAKTCKHCRHQTRELWRSTDPIPEEWKEDPDAQR